MVMKCKFNKKYKCDKINMDCENCKIFKETGQKTLVK